MLHGLSRSLSLYIKAAVLSVALFTCQASFASNLVFALFGDVYISADHKNYLKGMLADMAAKGSDLAISTGGIKPANQNCQDKNLLATYPLFAAAPLPTFYIPGDAEWTLCNKNANGSFEPEERLNLLRKTFYQSDRSLGQPSLPLTRQADYPEHMRWQSGPALFVTLSMPEAVNPDQKTGAPKASDENRVNAANEWATAAFADARKQDISMLVMIMPREPGFDTADANTQATKSALTELLLQESKSFPGQILLVHGGNGVHRIDQPLINPENNLPVQNFTRVETYGALQQGWVQVRIERNKKSGDDPVNRTEFLFESFPWPPLDMGDEEEPVTTAN